MDRFLFCKRPLIVAACILLVVVSIFACTAKKGNSLQPVVVTGPTAHDTDDPAIWINLADPAQSLIIGTDKDSDGGLYVFDLNGKNLKEKNVLGLKRPNNVDIAYGLLLQGRPTDIAVVTERETDKLRIFSLPDMKPVDGGGIPVFEGEKDRKPMGIALYTRSSDSAMFAVVGRKTGPAQNYLWQYRLSDDGTGKVGGKAVRKFGSYSGKKEIESIAVDNELGYIYYSDEMYGVHKYYANPEQGNGELALFGTSDFKEDIEGISIYKSTPQTGYILISNQQADQFIIYPREGARGNVHQHQKLKAVNVAAHLSDGSDVTSLPLGPRFPKGLFVTMSEGRVFHYYDWRQVDSFP